jgi:hypothetical protein
MDADLGEYSPVPLETPIEQSMMVFFGWVTGKMAELLDWVVDVLVLLAVDEGSLPLQVMSFALVLMRCQLICGGSGVFPLCLAEKQ